MQITYILRLSSLFMIIFVIGHMSYVISSLRQTLLLANKETAISKHKL